MAPAEGNGDGLIAVEVLYAPAAGQIDHCALRLPSHSTVQDAISASGLLQRHQLAWVDVVAGVWGRVQPLTQRLRERDRVELYRPLQVDPKESRRLRYRGSARKAKQPAKAGLPKA
jgi:uncharacterized protein